MNAHLDTTWAPAIGDQVATSGGYTGKAYVSVDVSPVVTGTGPVSFAVRAVSSISQAYRSRESSSGKPERESAGSGGGGGQTIVFALGDGADNSTTSRDLANYVISQSPARFFYLGDVYESGTATEFANSYAPLYGALGSITDPVIGNLRLARAGQRRARHRLRRWRARPSHPWQPTRDGQAILAAAPLGPRFELPPRLTYGTRQIRLLPGAYSWTVRPSSGSGRRLYDSKRVLQSTWIEP